MGKLESSPLALLQAEFVQFGPQAASSSCTAEGLWRLTPLQLRPTTGSGSGEGVLSSFSNGLFSPDDRPLPQVEPRPIVMLQLLLVTCCRVHRPSIWW